MFDFGFGIYGEAFNENMLQTFITLDRVYNKPFHSVTKICQILNQPGSRYNLCKCKY